MWGRLIIGSGFIAAPNLPTTTGLDIVGAARSIIKYINNNNEGEPLSFDPNLNFALLWVRGHMLFDERIMVRNASVFMASFEDCVQYWVMLQPLAACAAMMVEQRVEAA